MKIDRLCKAGCGQIIKLCTCGEWDCGFYKHLGSDCPTQEGVDYREMIAESVRKRDAAPKN